MPEQFPNPALEGIHPESGLYHVDHMPLPEDPSRRIILEKQLAGQPLTLGESMRAGRDATVDVIGDYPVLPDHVYRAIDARGLEAYQKAGAVSGREGDREFAEGTNAGIDWYLGGVALKYGDVILEAPASPDYFQPANHMGTGMSQDPKVRHMKSSPAANPVPLSMVNAYKKNAAGDYDRIAR